MPMPAKNVYVAEADLPLFEEASDFAGGMAAAVAEGLRLYVDRKRKELGGMDEIELQVNEGPVVRTKRFTGRRVARFESPQQKHLQTIYTVYETAKGNFAVYERVRPNWAAMGNYSARDWEDPETWDPELYRTDERRLSVCSNLDKLRSALPEDVAQSVTLALQQPCVEDLDI